MNLRLRRTPTLILALLLLASCAAGGGGGSPDETDDSDGGGSGGAIEHPPGDEAVLVVAHQGGFVPIDFMARQLPAFVLTGDGRVFMPGAEIAIFPGPALPSVQTRQLTEDGVQALLAELTTTAIFDENREFRGAQNTVADASDTVFTLRAGGRAVEVVVYALGALDPEFAQPGTISSTELEAHRILQEILDGLMQLESWLPDGSWADDGWQVYEPDSLRLYVRDATNEPPDQSGVPGDRRAWPVATDPAAFGEEDAHFGDGTRCGVVTGADAVTWLADLQTATQLTRWTPDSGETIYAVTPRPTLPHEEGGCPELVNAA